MTKNYIGFVNDNSGSMSSLTTAACKDYNANIAAIKDAATREMLDTVVSVVAVGVGKDNRGQEGCGVTRQVMVSNPHVLKPITSWQATGGTPLYDGIGDMIEMLKALPDANKEDVSFLVLITTDGAERHSTIYNPVTLRALMLGVMKTGRWTFVFRVPKNSRMDKITTLGVSQDNIQQWETTSAGMAESTAKTTAAMNTFFSNKAAGMKSTSAFYADATKVNVAALEDVSSKISLYVVPDVDNGIEIRPFILRHRMEYLKGSAFYQLTKTEAKVGYMKQILVRDRQTGKFFAGKEARDMIGLPHDRNARLHPGDHKNFDLFIQSESINRKLVGGTGVAYWKDIGVPYSEAELKQFQEWADIAAGKVAAPVKPAVVQLPAVPVSNAPTKSPIPVTPRVQTVFFMTREEARQEAQAQGKSPIDLGKTAPKGKRWTIG